MRIRGDVYLGDNPRIDISFLKRRKSWLPHTGIYLEFLLRGVYQKQVDFQIVSPNDGVTVTRHAWNRFFLNVQHTETVEFVVTVGDKVVIKEPFMFQVAELDVPLMFSVLNLFGYSVSDVRFFANRLSENLVNSTRIQYFSPKTMENLAQMGFEPGESYWRLYELLFSILTERGIVVYITPFGQRVPYPLEFLEKLKPILWEIIERSSKFRLVWDFSEGLRRKELSGFVDSTVHRFKNDVPLVVRKDMIAKVGGEGFSHQFENVRLNVKLNPNEKGTKILRLRESVSDFYVLRQFVSEAVKNGYGVEYVYYPKAKSLHNMHYSLSRALFLGYTDAKKGK